MKKYRKMQNQHITNGNCSPPCSAVRVPENCSRRKRLCAIFFHHILRLLVLLRKPLSAIAKRQLPWTLGEINIDFAGY